MEKKATLPIYKFCLYGLFFLFTNFSLSAQSIEKVIEQMEQVDSGSRIRSLCIYYDNNTLNKNSEQFDALLKAAYRIAHRDNDTNFKDYLDFYKRISTVISIPDDDSYDRGIKAVNIIKETQEYYQSIGDQRFVALCVAYIGHYYFIIKEYEKSLEELLIADEKFQKVGYDKFPDMGKHLHNMALVFYFFRHYDKVAQLMEISVQIPAYGVNYQIQRYNTLGAAYTHLKKYEKAIRAFVKTKETAVFYKDTFWIAYASRNLANVYLEQGKYTEALHLYQNNLKFITQYKKDYEREYAHYLLGLTKTYVFLKDYDNAKKYLKRVKYKSITNINEPLFMFGSTYQDVNYWLDFYEVQHRYHYSLKDYKNAYHYTDSLYAIKYKIDRLFNGLEVQVAQNRIEAKDKQYENDKKEATIKSKNKLMFLICGLLAVITIAIVLIVLKNRQIHKQNKIINSQLGELTKTLEQKQMLLSEFQHRVKNNLQHVISILEIQKESVNFNNIDELIRGNQNRIHSMALLHKKLNVSENVNDVDFKKYVTELSELVKESYNNHTKQISLNLHCEIDIISIEKALPLGLIITELVSNSMKHAFKKQTVGIITIQITPHENVNRVYYSDNGIGFDFNQISEKGLGQEIIKGLIDQLNGTVETHRDNGFELIIYYK